MIAYLILVHRYPEQFKRLFKAIYDPSNHYVVHVDKHSGPALANEVALFLSTYENAAILDSKPALWGGYSLVDAALRGMAKALEMNPDWRYFINLSGQDFPLKTQARIAAFLRANEGREFLRVLDQQRIRPDTLLRIKQVTIEAFGRIFRTPLRRPFLKGVRPYIGNQWMTVTREFCEFASGDRRAARFKAFYRNSFIADEGFFPTLMMSSNSHGEIVSDDMRTIDWVPDGDIKLRPRTFVASDVPMLTSGPNLFARKFDMSVDSEVIDLLEADLAAQSLADTAMSASAPRGLTAAA
ncbi:beta-1,6-N-acetylglucosaminyltransferase [Phenylobacterium immobile]|uniref:beta-1,6-N-acetylglucosaminyltransferase n=1 Tax=Phenylobacterium immobile TaxID=21 RepID=UPI000AA26FCA|nr:beta-1,6-N-acetylglucosaminyltransferase [Phenylobacterium immobile]